MAIRNKNKSKWPSGTSGGSLLIECLLSVVILSVSLALIIQAMTSSLRAMSYSTSYMMASLLAGNKMTELHANPNLNSGFSQKQSFDVPWDLYEYAIDGVDLNTSEAGTLKEVGLDVIWKSGQRKSSIKVDSYVLGKE